MSAVPKPEPYDKTADRKNVRLAADLDGKRCQWCLFQEGVSRGGSAPHHVYGRRHRWDIDAIITLCVQHHSDVHTAKQVKGKTCITKEALIKLMDEKVIPARLGRATYFNIS